MEGLDSIMGQIAFVYFSLCSAFDLFTIYKNPLLEHLIYSYSGGTDILPCSIQALDIKAICVKIFGKVLL